MLRYLVWLLAIIILIIILIILIIPGGKRPKIAHNFYDYASSGSNAILTIDGPINSEVLHFSLQINVNANNVTYEQFRGYNGKVEVHKVYPSSFNDYNNFIHAIYHAGFTIGTKSPTGSELGYCPLGERFIYQLNNDNQTVLRYWSTSCSTPKTYKGNAALTQELFQAQVPDYFNLSSGLEF